MRDGDMGNDSILNVRFLSVKPLLYLPPSFYPITL